MIVDFMAIEVCGLSITTLVALNTSDIFSCKHYVRYEGSMTLIGINIVGLMMLVR